MKLSYVDVCGFRGYRKPLRVDFADGFTVIEGRNGVGKSTICDAVEFVLTGTIGKYLEAKAAGETVADYIWWSGEGPKPTEHYVEVGFHDGEQEFVVRREQFAEADPASLADVVVRLCDATMQPSSPLAQLCRASIIRDEHIAALSLDLGERERFTLLRDAIGATDADVWVERGRQLVASAKKRVQTVQAEANVATQDVTEAGKRIDELRTAIVEEGLVAGAVARLQAATGSTAAPDRIAEVGRTDLVERTKRRDEVRRLANEWQSYEARRESLGSLTKKIEEATTLVVAYELELEDIPATILGGTTREVSQRARDLAVLADLGRQIGLNHDSCPLCASGRSHLEYERGIAAAEAMARQLDAAAVEQQEIENKRLDIQSRLASARNEELQAGALFAAAASDVEAYEFRLELMGFAPHQGRSPVDTELSRLDGQIQRMQEDLRIVQTLKTNVVLERAIAAEQTARTAYGKAQERLSIAQRGLTYAEGLNQGAQRAAGETLEQRLDRVLPLMTELYRRLRPHPLWNDIDYKIRGDVRRFLSLKVGDELNPQFIFSSGQRRATGLAFLLSVNLSLAWSRWQTILLDDPVQHVDDFRSVHLAEVMAQMIGAGRQIVCVVEDPALADHLCRRLPVLQLGQGARLSLGPDKDGALSIIERKILLPLATGVLVQGEAMAAG